MAVDDLHLWFDRTTRPTKHDLDSIAVKLGGTGPERVLFLAGLGDDVESFNFDATASAAMKRRYNCITPTLGLQTPVSLYARTLAFDFPGNGKSPPLDPSHQPASTFAEVDLIRALALHHGLAPPYIVCAHSISCITALYWQHLYPTELRGCVLLDPTPLQEDVGPPDQAWARTHPLEAARILYTTATRLSLDPYKIHRQLNIKVHVDISVPLEAGNLARIHAAEHIYPQVQRHYGAYHHLHLSDPRVVIGSILRFVL